MVANGVMQMSPRYYDKLCKRVDRVVYEDVQFRRELRARERPDEHRDDRLSVRERVAEAALNLKTRVL